MQTKDYSIVLDMMRTLPFRPFEVVEGDTGNVLHVTLLNNGDAMDLTGCKLCVIFASSSGFAMQDETSGITKSAESGAFDISLLPTAYGAGNVSADVQIYSGENDKTLITSTRFDFRCRKSLISGEIIRANTAYPPLIEAARAANEAASAALAAAERIGNDIGEMNVQADWSETDDDSDAFIRNKPAIPATPGAVGAAAATHAAQHGPNGTDPVTPIAHASRHASGGADALSPSAIGAAALSDGKVSPEQASATISTYTANHTLELSDAGKLVLMNLSSAGTLTIPVNASVAFPVGAELELCQYGAGALTIAAASGVTLVSLDSAVLFAGQYACAALKQIAANVWLLAGGVA
ncbi:MAG: BppU family phage baseplate upper protein [Clostridiaceae bacterium]